MRIIKKVFTWSEDRRKILKHELRSSIECEYAGQEVQELQNKGFQKLYGNSYKAEVWSKYINNTEYLVYIGE